ncbi:Rv3235 family protein [Leifsonia aquatica]|uniref:Rv3235 family protein n=1 Tax=Leifsonia aquatica TaxID=144185 RepID=UPI000467F08D|nr:Rv3235 family protein [Leifsonia aquatica]
MSMTATTRERSIPHDQSLAAEQGTGWIGHQRRPRPSDAGMGPSPSAVPGDGRPPPPVGPAPVAELTALEQDPALLCANLALCIVEILAGARSLDQIGRWVTDSVFVNLLRRTAIASRSRAVSAQEAMRPRFRIGTPLLSQLADGSIEAVVVVHQPSRSRAIAIRLERHRDRWRATVLSVL